MGIKHHFYLVSFDIASDKTRYRVTKTLLKYGSRVQKSVFECLLSDKQFQLMRSSIDKKIDDTCDSVRYYHLCQNCTQNIFISGIGSLTVMEDVIII